jgi:hypothetical protein
MPNPTPAAGRSSRSPRTPRSRLELREERRQRRIPSGGRPCPHATASPGSIGPPPTASRGSIGPPPTASRDSIGPHPTRNPRRLGPHRRRRRSTRPLLRTSRPPIHPQSRNRPPRPGPSSSPPGRRISSPPAAPPGSTCRTTGPRRLRRVERGRWPRRLRAFLFHPLRPPCARLLTKARPAQRIQPPLNEACVNTHRGRTPASPGHAAPRNRAARPWERRIGAVSPAPRRLRRQQPTAQLLPATRCCQAWETSRLPGSLGHYRSSGRSCDQ